jgi:hypothetical protein
MWVHLDSYPLGAGTLTSGHFVSLIQRRDRVRRRMFGPKRDKVVSVRKLHNVELHNV